MDNLKYCAIYLIKKDILNLEVKHSMSDISPEKPVFIIKPDKNNEDFLKQIFEISHDGKYLLLVSKDYL